MTNPNNAVGTPAANSGRTSVNAFNDVLQLLKKGVVSGWSCEPAGNMVVSLGGVAGTRDVAIAEDNAGRRTVVNNISEQPISVEIPAASTTSDYYYYIVAYVNNPPTGVSTVADNPSACGIIPVAGSAAKTYPTDSVIRAAITADGGVGTTAYYVVLRCLEITAGLTTITADNIKSTEWNDMATLAPSGVVASDNIDFTTLKGSTDIPVAMKNVPIGWDIYTTLVRVGNVVTAGRSMVSTTQFSSQTTTLDETIPEGFRPVANASLGACGRIDGTITDGMDRGTWLCWTVNSDGSLLFSTSGSTTSGAKRIDTIGSWITVDEWPS